MTCLRHVKRLQGKGFFREGKLLSFNLIQRHIKILTIVTPYGYHIINTSKKVKDRDWSFFFFFFVQGKTIFHFLITDIKKNQNIPMSDKRSLKSNGQVFARKQKTISLLIVDI